MGYQIFYGLFYFFFQGICNAQMIFIDVFCGWPGSAHDCRVWKQSPIYRRLINNPLPTEFHLLGDTAYQLDNFVMVPFKDYGHLTRQQKVFNKKLSSSRVVIEQAFARLKGTWRRLKFLQIHNLRYLKYIVISACILHNICISENNAADYMEEIDMDDQGNNDVWEEVPFIGDIPVDAVNKRYNLVVDLN